jgi:hypothetical protein
MEGILGICSSGNWLVITSAIGWTEADLAPGT